MLQLSVRSPIRSLWRTVQITTILYNIGFSRCVACQTCGKARGVYIKKSTNGDSKIDANLKINAFACDCVTYCACAYMIMCVCVTLSLYSTNVISYKYVVTHKRVLSCEFFFQFIPDLLSIWLREYWTNSLTKHTRLWTIAFTSIVCYFLREKCYFIHSCQISSIGFVCSFVSMFWIGASQDKLIYYLLVLMCTMCITLIIFTLHRLGMCTIKTMVILRV